MKHPTNLSKLVKVPLRSTWRHEANEFTPWLAQQDHLDELATTLGLSELAFVATEHWVGDFKLDILCTNGEHKVIIENQLAETDHKHLGQLLAYAAGVEARTIIWVAETFRPEHAAALQFLNDNTIDDLSFFGVQIELWRIDDSPPAPKFEVVVKPNNWTKTGREQARVATSASPTQQLQFRFWMALVEHLAKNAPQIRPQTPRPQNWLITSIGRSGFELNSTANTRAARLSVELWLPGKQAKIRFAQLKEQRLLIEQQLGYELDWQELPDSKACRITTYRLDSSIEDGNRWEEYLEWLAQRLVMMDKVFRPIVKALP